MKQFFRNKSWWLYLPIAAAPLLLFGIPLVAGKVLYWGAAGLQFVPWREFAYVQLEQGVLPLWNPLNGMGAPLIANYQLAFFYPPTWLTFFGHWLAGAPGVAWVYTLLLALHMVWAGAGMALLLRSLGIRPLGQAVGGLAFGMSGYLVARATFFNMVWVGAWLPWMLWAASGIASPFSDDSDRKRSFWLVVFTALMLLAGHAQLSWYILLLAGIWILYGSLVHFSIKTALSRILLAIGLMAVGALLAVVQLLPTFEYLLHSYRADAYEFSQAMTYSFWPWRLLTFLNAEMFGNPGLGDYWGYAAYWEDAVFIGVIPLFLAIGSLAALFRRSADLRRGGIALLWGISLMGFLFALGGNTPLYPWLYRHFPTFDLFQAPARWMLWPVASLCILAGLSTERWERPRGRELYWTRLGVAGFVAVFIGALIGSLLLPGLKPGLMRAFMVFAAMGAAFCSLSLTQPAEEGPKRRRWSLAVVLILSLDLVGASLYLNPFISASFYRPEVLSNAEAYREGRVFISAEDEYALKFGKYLRFSDTRYACEYNDVRLDILPNLNLLNGIASANNFDPLVPARYDRWMKAVNEINPDRRDAYLAFMGVTALIQRSGEMTGEARFLAHQAADLIETYPCVEAVLDEEEALAATLAKIEAIKEGEQCIIVEAFEAAPGEEYAREARITALETGYRRIKFRIDSDKPTWLRIGMTWYPDWRAEIDGEDAPVYHGDYVFSAIKAPAGSHQVEFIYRPVSFNLGAGMTLAGVICAILIGRLSYRRHNRKENQNIKSED